MIDSAFLATFLFVAMRMSGCVLMNPFLSRRELPMQYKAGLILVLTLAVTTYTDASAPVLTGSLVLVVMLLKEFLVGYVIGFIISLFSYVVSFSGEIMDTQMGISMSKIYDPGSNANLAMSATFFNILYMLLFFTAGGHITMMRLFLLAGEIAPYGELAFNTEVSTAVLGVFCQCTIMAVKFAMPIIAIELLVEMGVGIIMKAVPQINVFVVNIQAKLLIGLILMVFLFVPFANFLEGLINTMFNALEQVLVLL